MAKKQFFLIVDTETTVQDTVADFGAIVADRQGKIHAQCAVLVADHFDKFDLFYRAEVTGFWGKKSAERRKADYVKMLESGSRMLSSVNAVNRWLEKAIGKFNPTLTAYNLPFDVDKCQRTEIDLNGFPDRFCLWAAAVGHITGTKAYKQFALENHLFNNPTDKGNMTYKTGAEPVAGFLHGEFMPEPHTAIEDAINFELPILKHIVRKKNWRDKIVPYDWQKHQVKNHFQAKG